MRSALLLLLLCSFLPAAPARPSKAADRLHAFAPPVIPHENHGGARCVDCHEPERTTAAPGIPHRNQGDCKGCHVYQEIKGVWKPTSFVGEQGGSRVPRTIPASAPAAMAHAIHMRENCAACHGKVSRPRTPNPHPGRVNCRSCHVSQE